MAVKFFYDRYFKGKSKMLATLRAERKRANASEPSPGKILLLVLALALLAGCQPHVPVSPVVAIDDHVVVVPGGQAYTADRLGYWLSAEALAKLLDRLNALQRQVDQLQGSLPRTHQEPQAGTNESLVAK